MKQLKIFLADIFRNLRKRYKEKHKESEIAYVADIRRLLIYFNWSVNLLLIASGIQIAIAFQRGAQWQTSAWFKAVAIEFGIGLINRTIGFSRLAAIPTGFLWFVLFILMGVSVYANVNYEYGLKIGYTGFSWADIALLDAWAQISVYVYSVPVPLLIPALVYARQSQLLAIQQYEQEELDRIERNERSRVYQAGRRQRLGGKARGRVGAGARGPDTKPRIRRTRAEIEAGVTSDSVSRGVGARGKTIVQRRLGL